MVSGCFQRISIIISSLITIATLGNNTPSLELRRLRLRDMEWLSRDLTEPGLARRSFDLNPPLFHPTGGPVPFFQVEKLRTGVGRGMRCPEALKKSFLQCRGGSYTTAGRSTSTSEQADDWPSRPFSSSKPAAGTRKAGWWIWDLFWDCERPEAGWVNLPLPVCEHRPLNPALESSRGPEVPTLCHPSQHSLIQSN